MMHSVDYAAFIDLKHLVKHATQCLSFFVSHNKYVCVYNVIIINSLLIESAIVRSIIGDHPSYDQAIISRDINKSLGALASPKTVSVVQ